MSSRIPVVIVGGGLAGLACAGELERRGVPFRLFEAGDRLGGRVRTDPVDGFLLDRGFQVHFPAYPNARHALADADLDLRPWRNGARVWDGKRLRLVDRDRPLATLWDGALDPPDLLRLARLSAEVAVPPVPVLRALPDRSTAEELERRGFSEAARTRFFRPFYGGVFVDPDLRLTRRQFLFVQKMLGAAPASLPNRGMEAIPRALADAFPEYRVELNTPVTALTKDSTGRVDGVHVGAERIPASHVVLAVDADAAADLSGLPHRREWLGSVAVYFESQAPACEGAYLVLNGSGRGRVNEIAPVSNAAPGYAPPGRHLLCAVVLGDPPELDETLVESVRRETLAIVPAARELRLLRLDRIPRHQLSQPPGFEPMPLNPISGLLVAGEVATDCSIDGAVASGLRAAEAIAL